MMRTSSLTQEERRLYHSERKEWMTILSLMTRNREKDIDKDIERTWKQMTLPDQGTYLITCCGEQLRAFEPIYKPIGLNYKISESHRF